MQKRQRQPGPSPLPGKITEHHSNGVDVSAQPPPAAAAQPDPATHPGGMPGASSEAASGQQAPRLRLQPNPVTVATLRDAPVIRRFARNAGATRRIETTCYDTPDHRLFRAGFSLLVRRLGRRFIQTLARGGSQPITGLSRSWERSLPDASPDVAELAHLQADWLPQVLRDDLLRGPIAPVFTTSLRRRTRRLQMPDALVDLTFEDGAIEAGGLRHDFDRIELVLRAGDISALYEIGLQLLDAAPLRVGADRTMSLGYALATGTAVRAEKAVASALAPGQATDHAIAAILGACLAHLQANQGAARDGRHPDGVHQMRVALRRMRSALSLLRRDLSSPTMAELAREAKWAADQLGPARGWDVFLATTLNATLVGRTSAGRNGPDFDALRQVAEVPRGNAYEVVRSLIAAPRFSRFQLTLGQWVARRGWRNDVTAEGLAVLAEPAALVAARMLSRLHGKALKQGAHFKRLSAPERHELRITLKKLRYATEFFLPLFEQPGHGPRFLRRLARLQEALGLDHDAAETQPLLDELGRRSRAGGVQQAIGTVIGWQARDEPVNLDTLALQWQRFRALQPFWPKPVNAGAAPAEPRPG